MAILKGFKISKGETFTDGFREGYKSVMGRDAAVPGSFHTSRQRRLPGRHGEWHGGRSSTET